MNTKTRDLIQITFIYFFIALSGYLSYIFLTPESEILRFLIAHLVMTVVCFLFSLIKNNSSVYDAFWSVIPFLFCMQWIFIYYEQLNLFHFISFGVVSLWSWRLTLNWVRSWDGFGHEDWRYIDLAQKTGKFYPFVNFLGIHVFPTFMVFAGMLPLFFIFKAVEPNTLLFALGVCVSLLGVYFEFSADNVLYRFRNNPETKRVDILQEGLWGQCRYPNYLGEMLFWWGLAIIGQAFGAPLYTFIGCIAMTSMFLFISIPMKEERMLASRPKFKEYQQKVPLLIPFLGKKK